MKLIATTESGFKVDESRTEKLSAIASDGEDKSNNSEDDYRKEDFPDDIMMYVC